ncbi:MAG: RNA polymerase sigma factor [Bacteroidales bacterium]|nr:RNA polymerase sigma factor [Bacteroidales bacterium]
MPEWDDREILEGIKIPGKEEVAFNQLLQKYQERLYWHIRKIVIGHDDTDDVLQNTMIKVWKSLPNFRADSGLFTWLYRIATNEALTFLKQKKKRTFAPWLEVEQKMSETLESDPWFNGDEIQLKLQQAILKLPDKQRIVFNMKYFDEMKYDDMSKILETSVGALKASYHHAVKKIEKYFKED